jgi:hypothetical protein
MIKTIVISLVQNAGTEELEGLITKLLPVNLHCHRACLTIIFWLTGVTSYRLILHCNGSLFKNMKIKTLFPLQTITKHSPCFPSDHEIFLELFAVELFALLLQENAEFFVTFNIVPHT